MYYFKISPLELAQMDDEEVMGHWEKLYWVRTEEKRLAEDNTNIPTGKRAKKK